MARAASSAVAAALVAVLALAAGAAAQAQAPAPSPSANCGSAVTGLVGCLDYITPRSAASKPSKECCAGVKAALSNPAAVSCLCSAFGQTYSIPINLTRAAGLPAACGGDPAAFSKCNIKLPGAPGEAPLPPSGSAPGTGSPGSSKSAAAARAPVSLVIVLAAVAAPLLSHYLL